ncbi:MAG: carboxypeptidase-like regulatory domain-containing protein [Acidobacteriota bacterium]
MMNRLALAVIIALSVTVHRASSQSADANARAVRVSDQAKTPDTASPRRAITGLVLDENGEPVADAQIIIDRVGIRNQMQFINTDAAGRFKTPGLAPGLYAMEVHSPGFIIQPGATGPGFRRPGEHLIFNMVKGGVITGRVTDLTGDPVVSVNVTAHRVRDTVGRKVMRDTETWSTDDRGIYRLYGLNPGRYVVSVSEASEVYAGGSGTGDVSPTYYPATMRDAAVEITVQAGEEISGIDIEHRGEHGHAISGIVSRDLGTDYAAGDISVKMVRASSGEIDKVATLSPASRFAFYGVPDGEYDVFAQKLYSQQGNATSAKRRVVLRGADVVGVDLKLVKYGAIAGRVVMPKAGQLAPRCESPTRFQLEETLVDARSDSQTKRWEDQFFVPDEYWGSWRGSVLDQNGGFTIRNLVSGLYRLNVDLPGEDWYVRALIQPTAGLPRRNPEDSRSGIAIKSGESVTGVEVHIAEGAASLRGQVVYVNDSSTKDAARQARQSQIHLLPVEDALAGDLLQYAETLTDRNGSFEFKNRAPGRYWLVARPAPEVESAEAQSRPVAWDAGQRMKLRQEAKVSKNEIEVKPCQRAADFQLKVNLR